MPTAKFEQWAFQLETYRLFEEFDLDATVQLFRLPVFGRNLRLILAKTSLTHGTAINTGFCKCVEYCREAFL